MRIWARTTGEALLTLRGHVNRDSQPNTVEILGVYWNDQQGVTTIGEDDTARTWAVFAATGQPIDCPTEQMASGRCASFTQTFTPHQRRIVTAAWADLETIVTVDDRGEVARLSVRGPGATWRVPKLQAPITLWNPAGTLLFAYEDPSEEPSQSAGAIWPFAADAPRAIIPGPVSGAVWLEEALVVGRPAGEVTLFDPVTFAPRITLTGSVGVLTSAAISPRGVLAVGMLEGDLYLYDLTAAPPRLIAHVTPQDPIGDSHVKRLHWFGADERLLIVRHAAVAFWDAGDDQVQRLGTLPSVADAVVSPDGQWLAVAADKQVIITDTQALATKWAFVAHTDRVQELAWVTGVVWPHQGTAGHSGQTDLATEERLALLTWSGDGTARLWDWQQRTLIDDCTRRAVDAGCALCGR